MPNFKCNNIRCVKCDEVVFVHKLRWILDNSLNKLVPKDKLICLECKSQLEFIPEGGDIKCNLLKFDSMEPHQKKAIMVKRNREHYEKHDKRRIDDMKAKILQENRDQFKLK